MRDARYEQISEQRVGRAEEARTDEETDEPVAAGEEKGKKEGGKEVVGLS